MGLLDFLTPLIGPVASDLSLQDIAAGIPTFGLTQTGAPAGASMSGYYTSDSFGGSPASAQWAGGGALSVIGGRGLIPFQGAASWPGPGYHVKLLRKGRRAQPATPPGYYWARRRSMNPLNFKALRRSMRRVHSFAKIARSAITFTHRVKMRKGGRRRRRK